MYNVNQAGQLRAFDQFPLLSSFDSKFLTNTLGRDKVVIADLDSNCIRVIDVDKERVT